MAAQQLLEMTRLWHRAETDLQALTERILQLKRELRTLGDENEALRVDNRQLRYKMLCPECRTYLDSRRPGDTVVSLTCSRFVGP